MDIQLTEEQELLRSSIQRFLREQYDFDERRKIVATDEGWSRRHWKSFAELGLCAAPFQESSGGLGGGAIATMIVMQEFGRNLVVEPYFETIVLAGGLIEDGASPEQREAFLPKIMAGEAIWALAWAEGRSRYDFNNVTATEKYLNSRKLSIYGGIERDPTQHHRESGFGSLATSHEASDGYSVDGRTGIAPFQHSAVSARAIRF